MWSCVAEPHWKPEMLTLAQTRRVETIKIPTHFPALHEIKETRPSAAELYSREKVTRHTAVHHGTVVLSGRWQFAGNDISGVQPMLFQGQGQATSKVKGSRGSHLARANPMVVGIGALRCGRLLVAWLGRMAALFPTRSLF